MSTGISVLFSGPACRSVANTPLVQRLSSMDCLWAPCLLLSPPPPLGLALSCVSVYFGFSLVRRVETRNNERLGWYRIKGGGIVLDALGAWQVNRQNLFVAELAPWILRP